MDQLDMDEHHGIGGSYLRDPKTGKRQLVERTQEPSAEKAESASVAKILPAATEIDDEHKD